MALCTAPNIVPSTKREDLPNSYLQGYGGSGSATLPASSREFSASAVLASAGQQLGGTFGVTAG